MTRRCLKLVLSFCLLQTHTPSVEQWCKCWIITVTGKWLQRHLKFQVLTKNYSFYWYSTCLRCSHISTKRNDIYNYLPWKHTRTHPDTHIGGSQWEQGVLWLSKHGATAAVEPSAATQEGSLDHIINHRALYNHTHSTDCACVCVHKSVRVCVLQSVS